MTDQIYFMYTNKTVKLISISEYAFLIWQMLFHAFLFSCFVAVWWITVIENVEHYSISKWSCKQGTGHTKYCNGHTGGNLPGLQWQLLVV